MRTVSLNRKEEVLTHRLCVAVTVNQRSEYEPQARRGSKFKKRHVSNVADRIHSNTMKNMALIQRQIQANTNMTKNRLAVGQKVSGASMQ